MNYVSFCGVASNKPCYFLLLCVNIAISIRKYSLNISHSQNKTKKQKQSLKKKKKKIFLRGAKRHILIKYNPFNL